MAELGRSPASSPLASRPKRHAARIAHSCHDHQISYLGACSDTRRAAAWDGALDRRVSAAHAGWRWRGALLGALSSALRGPAAIPACDLWTLEGGGGGLSCRRVHLFVGITPHQRRRGRLGTINRACADHPERTRAHSLIVISPMSVHCGGSRGLRAVGLHSKGRESSVLDSLPWPCSL